MTLSPLRSFARRALFTAAGALLPATGFPADPVTLFVQPVGGTLPATTNIVHAGDGSGRTFVTDQRGVIRDCNRTWSACGLFMDIEDRVFYGGERGLLGLAFHPQFASNGFFFVYYTNALGDNVLARFHATGNPQTGDKNSSTVLLTIDHPDGTSNHNGGQIAFGPDGYLYVAVGDGGTGGAPAQQLGSLLGKILRLDVDSASPYAIPPSNPFVGTPGARGEVWAWGLRNPWRFSFDRTTGDLFIADVGQSSREEVNLQLAGTAGGRNYGWPTMEGSLCPSGSPACTNGSLTLPILEYTHANGDCSITGGLRVRGPRLPRWSGKYLFADYCTGRMWAGTEGAGGTWTSALAMNLGHNVSTFGEDESGDVYFGAPDSGAVYRIVEAPTVSISDATVTEGDSGQVLATFTGTVAYDPPVTLSVGWAAVAGTATAGIDFALNAGGRFGFAPGDTTPRTITVPVFGDTLDEANETFTVQLNTPMNTQIGDGVGLGTILDDDLPPNLSIGDALVTEGNAGDTPALFSLTLSAPSGRNVDVAYAPVPGSAGPADFVTTPGTVTIPAGQTTGTIAVPVHGDTLDEPNEAFLLNVSTSTAVLTRPQAQGTILDDDGRPALCRPIEQLPYTITQQGRYCLTRNLSTAQTSGAAITVASDYVVLDLQGFKIGGGGAGFATNAIGIYAQDRRNVTIRNGNVRGFLRGILLAGIGFSRNHLVEGLRVDGNTLAGIEVEGANHVVRRNLLVDTGGSTAVGPNADTFGIRVLGHNARILDNDVTDTLPIGTATGYAIHATDANEAVIERNRVDNASAAATTTGIYAVGGSDLLILRNRLTGFTSGVVFDATTGKYRGNLTSGVTTPYTGGTDAGGNQ